MSHSTPVAGQPRQSLRRRVAGVTVFLLGVLLSVGFYAAVVIYVPQDALLYRYLCAHPVEYVETWFFIWAVVALAAKGWSLRRERAAFRAAVLPPWSGKPQPVTDAGGLLDPVERLPSRLRDTLLVRRVHGALGFLTKRGMTDGLDAHLRDQADADANAVDGSYALVRFITWAIPILGFLGTVLGITDAIANVTPEQLATSISGVTDGLAIAFDTTAIALAYSMCIMFFTFVLDRREQGLLQAIDAYVERELAHRFERYGAGGEEHVVLFRRGSQLLLETGEQLLRRHSEMWTQTVEVLLTRFAQATQEQHERLSSALRQLLEATLDTYQHRLTAMEKQGTAATGLLLEHLDRVGDAVRETATILERQGERTAQQITQLEDVLAGEGQLLHLQENLNRNLHALAQAGTFPEVLHSLTAAVHLLTARAAGAPATPHLRQGNAA
jgi:hypothetical protein